MTSLLCGLALTLFTKHVAALQVTPNSPCASLCVDSNSLDLSDPNSSTIGTDDITCYDSEYASSSTGQTFQKCLSCLQDSTFSQGSENDQLAFLYNLRFTFGHCTSGPCSTSTACGDLETAWTNSDLDDKKSDYSYCAANGAVTDDAVSKCQSCVAASGSQDYLANFLTALDTGCKQQPLAGTLLGLNDTVFSKNMISSIDPTAEGTIEGDKKPILSTTQITGIAVGGAVAVLAVAGFFLIRCRKRRNRRLIVGDTKFSGKGQKKDRHRSSLSFRCQTHLTPRSPAFFPNPADAIIEEKNPYAGPHSALGSHPLVAPESPRQATWLAEKTRPGFGPSPAMNDRMVPLPTITTAVPTIPGNVHYLGSPKPAFFSPVDEPGSTTSTKSTAQLLPLRQYNPAEYGMTSPQVGVSPDGMYSSPTSGTTNSPLLSRVWEQRTPTWELPPRASSRPSGVGAWERVAAGVAAKNKRSSSNCGSPVKTTQFSLHYPPPPGQR